MQGSGMAPSSLARSAAPSREPLLGNLAVKDECRMKETVIESPLIGSGSQEEVDIRVKVLLDMGTSRGFLTYEELNERLPDEVVSPDKLDSLLMMIDEMGIKLIDESDIGDFVKGPKAKPKKPRPADDEPEADEMKAVEEEEIDIQALQGEIKQIDSELAQVRGKMDEYLKELGIAV